MAPTSRYLPVRSGIDGCRARNGATISRATYATDPIRSYDGSTSLPAKVSGRQRWQVMDRFKKRPRVMNWIKEYPYLLPYIALVVTIELIVEIF